MKVSGSALSAAIAVCLTGLGILALETTGHAEDKMLRPPSGRPEATFYRDANYSGPAVYVNEAKTDLGLNWPINSIRIASGRWELCERTNFRGTCRTYDRDTPILNGRVRGFEIQSMRPLGWSGGGQPGKNPSLRGMAAEFFAAPARDGYRIEACERGSANAACAMQTARSFCTAQGWRTATRQAMETVGGRTYLADVLCANTAR